MTLQFIGAQGESAVAPQPERAEIAPFTHLRGMVRQKHEPFISWINPAPRLINSIHRVIDLESLECIDEFLRQIHKHRKLGRSPSFRPTRPSLHCLNSRD